MNWLSQIIAVTGVTLRSIPQRLGSSIVAIIGIGGVVIVFTAVLSIAEGFRAAMKGTGDPQTVIVLRSGSDTEMTSGFSGEEARLIAEAPAIETGPDGPHASPELFVIVGHPLKRVGTDANVPLRGLTPIALAGAAAAEDRRRAGCSQPGTNEIVVGRAASRQFQGLIDRHVGAMGRSLVAGRRHLRRRRKRRRVGDLVRREGVAAGVSTRQLVSVGLSSRLASVDGFQTFKDALTTNPRLQVTVIREPDYYAQQSQVLQTIIRSIGFGIAGLMGLGAIFGAINTMYSAVANRTREIATLRALGFGSSPVVVSVMVEAVLLSLVGGLIGGLLAWAAFDGYQTATMNFQSFSQVAFAFKVSPSLLARGMFFALIMGLIGGLFPAIRAARLPVVTALRQL